MKKSLTGLLLFLGIGLSAQQEITIKDIWQKGIFMPDYVWGMRSMKDGDHYSKLSYDDAQHSVSLIAYNYEDGEANDTLFSDKWVSEKLSISDYAFSRDESKILLSSDQEAIYRYSRKANYYIYDRKSRKAERLFEGDKVRYPSFSPDGSKVAFVVNSNLYYRDLNNGLLIQITDNGSAGQLSNGASDWVYEEELVMTRAYEWSPDGKNIAFLRFDVSDEPSFLMSTYRDSLYPQIETIAYPKAGEANAKVSLWVYDLSNKSNKELATDPGEEYYIPRIQWTRSSNWLCYQRLNRHQNHLELIEVNIETAEQRTLVDEHSDTWLDVDDDLYFLENGLQFIWTSDRSGFKHIYLYDLQDLTVKQLTKGHWPVTKFYGIDEKKEVLYFQAALSSPLNRGICSIKLNGKKCRPLLDENGTWSGHPSVGFKHWLLTYSNANQAPIMSIADSKLKEIRVLIDNQRLQNTCKAFGLTEKTFLSFSTESGTSLNAWLIKPPDFDKSKKYPLFMYVYGGPGSQTVQNSWGGSNFIWFEMLAQKGYVVVSVDNRGTGGRGAEFTKQVYLQLGQKEVEDQIQAAQFFGRQSYIDANRIGIFGWSYGGFMAANCITRGADVFKTAISVAPVTHWKYYDSIYTERFMRTPSENPPGYEIGSPLNYADLLKGKYLLVHGTGDDNVHFQNSIEWMKALEEEGKDFDLMIYPDKTHSISGSKYRMHLYNKMTEFIIGNL